MISAKPSVPKCWVEGGELIGNPVSLHCESAKGSTPLKYTWRRERAGSIADGAAQSKCDLCWCHNDTAHQREYVHARESMYVYMRVLEVWRGGCLGTEALYHLMLSEQILNENHFLCERLLFANFVTFFPKKIHFFSLIAYMAKLLGGNIW